jgi:hypothetical protein
LNNATNAIRQGWVRYNAGELSLTTYTNLISMGSSTIPALGNSTPPNYSGSQSYNITYSGQNASYGYVRLFPWQGYTEFNYNNTLALNYLLSKNGFDINNKTSYALGLNMLQ